MQVSETPAAKVDAGQETDPTFASDTATAVNGNSSGNGIVAVDTPEDSILANYPQSSAFVYPAQSYTGLGAGTRAEQTYGEGNPLLAGHWRASNATEATLAKPSAIFDSRSIWTRRRVPKSPARSCGRRSSPLSRRSTSC